MTYDYNNRSDVADWKTLHALPCVLGQIKSWPTQGQSYPCDGKIPPYKLGAGLLSHIPGMYTREDLAGRLEVLKHLGLGGPINIWVNRVSDVWLPLLADYIDGK